MKKTIFYILIIFLIIFIPTITNAAGGIDDVIVSGKNFINSASSDITVTSDSLKNASNNIYNILFYVGTILSVLVGAILGIKIMIASTENKAKVKEALVPYIVGCIVIFGSFTIWKIAVTILNSI